MKIRTIKRQDKLLARKMKRFLERKVGRGVRMRQLQVSKAMAAALLAKRARVNRRKSIES